MRKDYAVEADSLKPYIVPWIAAAVAGSASGAAGVSGALTAHELNGPYHLGSLNRSQAPWVATDISAAVAAHVATADPHPQYVADAGDTMTGALLINYSTTGANAALTARNTAATSGNAALLIQHASTLASRYLLRAQNNYSVTPTDIFTLETSGRATLTGTLGIGITPTQALHVSGSGWLTGGLAIGTAAPSGIRSININKAYTNDSVVHGTYFASVDIDGAITATRATYGFYNELNNYRDATDIGGSSHQVYGGNSYVYNHDGSVASIANAGNNFLYNYAGTITTGYGGQFSLINDTTGTVSTAYGLSINVRNDAGTMSTAYGVYSWVNQSVTGGTITDSYAFYARQDRDAGTSTNAYLYYGTFEGTHAVKRGLWLVGETENSLSGKLMVAGDVEVGGEILAADGTVGAPAIAFLADTNTGIYRSGTDAFSLVAGGAAIANIGATGLGVNTAFDTTAALKVQAAATDDITLFLKQKASQTGRMLRVENSAGLELIVLDSVGNLQSGNPGFVSGLTGWQMTPIGNLEANNAWIRGELHASIFVMDEFHASGGTLYVAPAGKLENAAAVNVTTGIEAVFDIRTTSATGSGSQLDIRTTSATGSGAQLTLRTIENYFEITDPPSGHAMILSANDIVRCKALGLSVGIDLWDIWGVVTRVEDMTDYYRYYYERKSGGANALTIPAGTAIISYGAPGDGRIYLTADQNYAPYIQVFVTGAEPWNGQITPTTRIGRLDGVGLPGVSGIEQYGMVTSTDLSNASAPYIVQSNLQMFSFNVDSEWNNGNPTARITAGGAMKLGTDIDNANTTGFDFNPTTGALTIGSAAYPGSVTVYGSITVTSGSGYSNFADRPTSLSGINATEGAKLTGIAPGATVGATWGTNLNSIPTRFGDAPSAAGLYLTPTHLGYYNGSAWKAWIASSGEFYFGGNSGAHLEWNGSKLRGIGTDGTTEQWYAQSSDGKLYAAGGSVWLDTSAINIAVVTTGTPGLLRFDRSGSTVGSLGFLRSTGPVPTANDGMIFYNADSTKFRFLGATATEFDHAVYMGNFLDMNGYDIIDANNVLTIRTTAP